MLDVQIAPREDHDMLRGDFKFHLCSVCCLALTLAVCFDEESEQDEVERTETCSVR